MVLTADHDLAGGEILHRVICTVMAELHLQRARAAGETQQLMAETDAEEGHVGVEQLADRLDRIVAGLRIARAVGQKHPVRLQTQYRRRRHVRRDDRDVTAARGEHPQDVALDAVVVGDDMQGQTIADRMNGLGMALAQFPDALGPGVGLGRRDLFRQIHALKARKTLCGAQSRRLVDPVAGLKTAVLGALLAQQTGQPSGVDIGDADDALAPQIGVETLRHAEVAGQDRQVADDEARGLNAVGLLVLRVGPDIADVGVGQGDELAQIRGIGEDLLISGHGGVEHHLADARSIGADRRSPEDGAVLQHEYRGFSQGFLRSGRGRARAATRTRVTAQ